MIAIIPCAGKGTRRLPDTRFTPKILLDYQGDPLIEHIVRPIDASDCFERIVFVVGPKHGQRIIDYVRHNPFETPVKFVWQNEPLGFGHAVLQARDEVFTPLGFPPRAGGLRGMWNPLRSVSPRPVLIATDDGVRDPADPDKPSFDLIREMVGSSISTLGVKWVGNVRQHGMVIVEDYKQMGYAPRPNSPSDTSRPGRSGVRVERLIEKPYWDEGGLVMTGLYYVRESRRLFRCLHKLVKSGRCLGGEFQFTHALQMMIDVGTPFRTCYHEWVDCGKTGKREDEKTRERESEKTGKRENGKARERELNPSANQSRSYEDYLKEIGEIG